MFSTTLTQATWHNTKLMKGDIAAEVRKLKAAAGPNLVLMGSGSVVSQLSAARLVDEYQIIVNPIVIGSGKTLFQNVQERLALELTSTRVFKNGNVALFYRAASS